MTTLLTVEDIIKSAKKYGDDKILVWDKDTVRDNQKNNAEKGKGKKKNVFDCTWIPIKFKNIDGSTQDLKLQFTKIIIASSAKLPMVTSGNPKNMFIVFRTLTKEEILSGDYAPKKMNSEKEQEIENARANKAADNYIKINDNFIKALSIIDDSYKSICSEIKKDKTLDFTIKKGNYKTTSEVTVNSIKQTHRKDTDNPNNDPIELETPLTRIKLLLDPDTGIVGVDYWDNNVNKRIYKPNVYDIKKTIKNGNNPVLAKAKNDKILEPLNSENANKFITYKSLISGTAEFPEIVSSPVGLSLKNYFGKELYVKHHKVSESEPNFSPNDMKNMIDDEISESSESEDETNPKSKPLKNTSKESDVDSDLEDHVDNQEVDESDAEVEDLSD